MQSIELTLPDNTTLRGLHWNPGAPIKVLALHGWLDNANSFVPMAQYLPAEIELVALDLVGHGLSDHRPPGHWYHLIDYVRDAALSATVLNWKQFHLLGHSLGGGVCCSLAACAPEAILSLAVIEGLGIPGADSSQAGQRLRSAWQGLNQHMHSKADTRRLHTNQASAINARLATNNMQPESAKLLIERGLQAVDGGYTWRTDRRLRLLSPIRYTETEVLHLLEAIECPVFQVLPDPISVYIPKAVLQRRPAMIKQYQEVEFKGYHHLHMDNPQPCANAIFNFFRTQHAA